MGRSPHGIIAAFLAIMKKGDTYFCMPTMEKLLELIGKYQNIHIKKSRGHECTHIIEKAGLMKRRRRWIRNPETGIRSKSSVWSFTWFGLDYCISKGMDYAIKLKAKLIEWMKRQDGRFPTEKDLTGDIAEVRFDNNGSFKIYIKPPIGPWLVGGDAPAVKG